jgi:hypothetical protein
MFQLMAGTRLVGGGVLEINGANRLVVHGDVEVGIATVLQESGVADGTGHLRYQRDQTLTGPWNVGLTVAPDVTLGSAGAVFGRTVEIEPGATLRISEHQALTVNGSLSNRGTMRMYSRNVNTWLQGSGTVFNHGRLRVEPIGGSSGLARLHVGFQNLPGGTIEIVPEAQLLVGAGAAVRSEGLLRVDGYLAIENTTPELSVTLGAGAAVEGGGTVRFHGTSRLVVEAPVDFAANLELVESSRAEGPGPLTLLADQNLTGRYLGPVILAPTSRVGFYGAVFEDALTVEGGAAASIAANQTLTIHGVMTNRSTLRMFSRNVDTWLAGNGRVHNDGTIQIVPVGGSGGFARLATSLTVGSTGSLRVDAEAQLLVEGAGRIDLGGLLRIDGYLPVVDGTPTPEIRMLPGASIAGDGLLRLHGTTRLHVDSPTLVSANLELMESSRVSGGALLTLGGDQNLSGRFEAPVLLDAGSSVGFRGAVFTNALSIDALASAFVHFNQVVTVDGPVTNRGSLQLFSRNVNTWIQGVGPLVNAGTIRVTPVGGSGAFARILTPIEVLPGSRLHIEPEAQAVVESGGRLGVGGEIQVDGFLSLDGSGAGRELALATGARIPGSGTLRLHGSSRVLQDGPAIIGANLELFDTSRAEGPGLLRLEYDQNLSGRYLGPVQLASNSVVGFASPVFTGAVDVEPGADTFIHFNQTLTVDGALTNRGSLRMFSRNVNTWLSGAGIVINPGLIRVIPVGGSGGWARVHVRVEVPAEGIYRVEDSGINGFGAGGSLRVLGELNVVGALQFWNEGPGRSLALAHGGRRTGTGSINLFGSNRFEVTGDATLEGGLVNLVESADMAGDGTLSILSGATLRFDHAVSFPGSMLVSGTLTTVSGTSRIGGTLTLGVGGVVNNPSALEVGAFSDLGGTVNGAMPIVVGFGPGGFTIRTIQLEDPILGTRRAGPTIEGEARVVLECSGPAKARFTLEVSSDLRGWRALSAVVEEISPGRYRVQVPQGSLSGDGVFFRLAR